MKTKITATSAVMAALIGLSHAALADECGRFTPVEDLSPEQRQQVFDNVAQMTNGAELDWDHIAIGVNENGQVVLMKKLEVNMQGGVGSPSSFGAMVREPDETK